MRARGWGAEPLRVPWRGARLRAVAAAVAARQARIGPGGWGAEPLREEAPLATLKVEGRRHFQARTTYPQTPPARQPVRSRLFAVPDRGEAAGARKKGGGVSASTLPSPGPGGQHSHMRMSVDLPAQGREL